MSPSPTPDTSAVQDLGPSTAQTQLANFVNTQQALPGATTEPQPPESPEQQQIRQMLDQMTQLGESRKRNEAQRQQIMQQLQQEMQPGSVQKYLPKPTASNILQDMMANFAHTNMNAQFGFGPPKPIYQQRLENALAFQQQRVKSMTDMLSATHQSDAELTGQERLSQMAMNEMLLTMQRNAQNKLSEERNQIRIDSGFSPFPDSIVDEYNNMPDEFKKLYPVATPIKPASGLVNNAQLRSIQQQRNTDMAKLLQWEIFNKKPVTVNTSELALQAAQGNKDAVTALQFLKEQKTAPQMVNLDPSSALALGRMLFSTGAFPPGIARSLGADGMSKVIAAGTSDALKNNPDDPLNIAMNHAMFQADTKTYTDLLKRQQAIHAFAQTARANLQLYKDKLAKVIDTGSPILNGPFRSIDRTLLGSADQAALDAALRVASDETARVVTQNNLSGNLTDSARSQYEKVLHPDANLEQAYASVSTLLADIDNRERALDDQVSSIKGRLRADTGSRTPTPTTNPGPISPPPANNATPPAPMAVQRALQSVGPGIHKLSDGSRWQKNPDGSIVAAK